MSRKRYVTSNLTLAELLRANGLEPEQNGDESIFEYLPTPAVQWVLEEVRSSSTLSTLAWTVQDKGGE